jgi:autotransporter-associated beta strand protein
MKLIKRVLAAALILLAFAHTANAQTYTWTSTTDGNWDVGSNWDTNPLIPVSGDTTELRFNASGTTSYTATNNITGIPFTLNRLTFNNTGTGLITLAGATDSNSLNFAGTNPTVDVQNGSVLFLGQWAGTANVTKTGSGTFIHDSNNTGFTGTLTIDGGTFINRATNNATTNFNPVSIVVNNGGTYQFGDNLVGNPNLPNSTFITINSGGVVNWQEGEDFGGFNLNGGTLNLQQGNANTNGATAQSWTSGSILGSFVYGAGSGTRVINKTTSGTVTIGDSVGLINHTINIEEGTLSFLSPTNINGTLLGLTFGGASTTGVFEYQGTNATRTGNVTFNAGGGEVRVTNAATTMTMSGNLSGAGAITKTGPGTLALTGTLGHAGGTNLAEGTLRVTPSATAASSGFTIANGTTLAVSSNTGVTTFTAPSVSLGNAASTIQFDLNSATVPTVPLLTVTNNDGLNLNGGTHTLRVTNLQPLAAGTYTAIDYVGTGITAGFSLSLPGRTPGSIVYNTVNTSIDVSITGTSDTIRWGGQINGTWDTGTAANVGGTNNWRLVSNGNDTNFIATDTVTFDDTASGNFTVSIPTTVLPASVTVNNTANTYTLQGAGGIGGTATLTKQGTGTLILANDNSYSGATTVSEGTLQIGNGGETGSIGTSNLDLAAATVGVINRTGTLELPGVISGTGSIEQNGSATTIQSGNSPAFTGTVTINGGTFISANPSGTHNFNPTSIVVNNGGTYQFGDNGVGNPNLPDATYITINTGGLFRSQEGEQFGGFNLFGGSIDLQVGDININGATPSEIRSGTMTNTATGITGAGTINKTTAGTVTLTGMPLNNNGGVNIQEGTIATNSGFGVNGALTFGTDTTAGTLQYTGANATVAKAITLNTGGGTVDVSTGATAYTLSGVMSGTGGLTKTGPGTLILSGTNTYAGNTTVAGGTLLVNGQTGFDSSTGSGTVTVQSGARLGGNGRVAGEVTIDSSGTVAAGTAVGNSILSTGSSVTVNGTMEVTLFGTGAGENGQLNAGGNATLGSGSTIQLALGTLTANELRTAVGIGNTRNYTVLTSAGTVSGTFGNAPAGTVDFSAQGFIATEWAIAYNSTDIVLTFTPVPEPLSVLGFSAIAIGVFGGLRRRLIRRTA